MMTAEQDDIFRDAMALVAAVARTDNDGANAILSEAHLPALSIRLAAMVGALATQLGVTDVDECYRDMASQYSNLTG